MKFNVNEEKKFRFSVGTLINEKSEKTVPAEAFLIADGAIGKVGSAVKEE
jgi:hypothetical protein